MPRLQPGQFGVGRARAGLGHFSEPKIDAISQDRRQQQGLVLGRVAALQMRKVPGESRPLIDFEQQFGDLDVRQSHGRLVDQRLRGVRHRCIERRDLQARLGDDGIWQIVGRRHPVNSGKLLFQQFQPVVQIGVVSENGKNRTLSVRCCRAPAVQRRRRTRHRPPS